MDQAVIISQPLSTCYKKPIVKTVINTRFPAKRPFRNLGQIPLSPPISPETEKALPQMTTILLADHVSNSINDGARNVDDCNMVERMTNFSRAHSPLHIGDYRLVLEFKSQMGKAFGANRRKWAQRELAQLKEDNLLKSIGRRSENETISKSRIKAHSKNPSTDRSGPEISNSNSLRVNNKSRFYKSLRRVEITEGVKKVAREDRDFSSLPDHCPPLSSLPDKVNSLKVDWKGMPIDLKSDPFANLLHPDEIQLAANLRLDCATYLTSKRRIFISRKVAYKIGKEFRKTDAQQACKIDVNKASRLWQAFQKVGWFDGKWVPD